MYESMLQLTICPFAVICFKTLPPRSLNSESRQDRAQIRIFFEISRPKEASGLRVDFPTAPHDDVIELRTENTKKKQEIKK